MQMTLQIRAVLLLQATTKLPPACVPIQRCSTQPICIPSHVLFDNLFQPHKGASKLCIAHFVKVIIDDNSGIKRLILFCRWFYQIEDKSWFPILFWVVLLGITEGTNQNLFINKKREEDTLKDHHCMTSDRQRTHTGKRWYLAPRQQAEGVVVVPGKKWSRRDLKSIDSFPPITLGKLPLISLSFRKE